MPDITIVVRRRAQTAPRPATQELVGKDVLELTLVYHDVFDGYQGTEVASWDELPLVVGVHLEVFTFVNHI